MNKNLRFVAVLPALCLFVLVACAKGTASVNVLGVNYTKREFSFRVKDPSDPKNEAAGDLVDSYSAGGIQCCFRIPNQWHPGIKVQILTTQWTLPPPPNDDLKNLKEERASVEVELPRYAEGKPGDLWIVRNANGSFGAISSNFQPDSAKWPGEVKGWPVPSKEYLTDLWEKEVEHARNGVSNLSSERERLLQHPLQEALASWQFKTKYLSTPLRKPMPGEPDWYYSKEFLSLFSGPDDPRFYQALLEGNETNIRAAESRLAQVIGSKP